MIRNVGKIIKWNISTVITFLMMMMMNSSWLFRAAGGCDDSTPVRGASYEPPVLF